MTLRAEAGAVDANADFPVGGFRAVSADGASFAALGSDFLPRGAKFRFTGSCGAGVVADDAAKTSVAVPRGEDSSVEDARRSWPADVNISERGTEATSGPAKMPRSRWNSVRDIFEDGSLSSEVRGGPC